LTAIADIDTMTVKSTAELIVDPITWGAIPGGRIEMEFMTHGPTRRIFKGLEGNQWQFESITLRGKEYESYKQKQ
jgi:hypothetical protein